MFIYLLKISNHEWQTWYNKNGRSGIYFKSYFERHPFVCYFHFVGARRNERFPIRGTIKLWTVITFASPYRYAGKRDSELQKRREKLLLFFEKQTNGTNHRLHKNLQLCLKQSYFDIYMNICLYIHYIN